MDDMRESDYSRKLKQRAKLSGILIFLMRNKITITLILLFLYILLFPTSFGGLIGEWFNKLSTAFNNI